MKEKSIYYTCLIGTSNKCSNKIIQNEMFSKIIISCFKSVLHFGIKDSNELLCKMKNTFFF